VDPPPLLTTKKDMRTTITNGDTNMTGEGSARLYTTSPFIF